MVWAVWVDVFLFVTQTTLWWLVVAGCASGTRLCLNRVVG